ncbi:hypothetical protein PI125_g20589 [Phytophthora idaei]|nr:hypothetical protein PI125_g20589 [Phytophthora idaei]
MLSARGESFQERGPVRRAISIPSSRVLGAASKNGTPGLFHFGK